MTPLRLKKQNIYIYVKDSACSPVMIHFAHKSLINVYRSEVY